MIYWLKIRDRGNYNFVLRNLNSWLGAFSNKDAQIYIYSGLNLPTFYSGYKILTREKVLEDLECKELLKSIEKSSIGDPWKRAAFALCSPYFYFKDDEIILNQDACDMTMFGNVEKYINNASELLNKHNLTTISYDYIYSHNPFHTNKFIPNHWTFGINVSKRQQMKELIKLVIANSRNIIKSIPYAKKHEINIDILISQQLMTIPTLYNCFITKEGFSHDQNDFFYSRFKHDLNKIEMFVNGRKILVNKHPKTIVI